MIFYFGCRSSQLAAKRGHLGPGCAARREHRAVPPASCTIYRMRTNEAGPVPPSHSATSAPRESRALRPPPDLRTARPSRLRARRRRRASLELRALPRLTSPMPSSSSSASCPARAGARARPPGGRGSRRPRPRTRASRRAAAGRARAARGLGAERERDAARAARAPLRAPAEDALELGRELGSRCSTTTSTVSSDGGNSPAPWARTSPRVAEQRLEDLRARVCDERAVFARGR